MKVITGYFSGIIYVINGVFLVLITGISGHNCRVMKTTYLSAWIYGGFPGKATQI